MKKSGFTLVELLVVITIIGILSSVGLSTFTTAQIKARDAKRKAHLRQLANTFEAYFNDYKKYPDSEDGKIKDHTWGTSFIDNNGTVYMIKLPTDPVSGYTYYYDSLEAGTKFQLYAYLENTEDPMKLTMINPPLCGTDKPCNYGVASSNITPEEGRQ